MKIAEIVELEKTNTESIILLNEGLFWRAYERSAHRFIKHIKQYQITKKYIKCVKADIVYCGFPQNALNDILQLAGNRNIKKEEKQIVINGFEPANKDFEKWKNELPDKELPENSLSVGNSNSNTENDILTEIRNFQVISKSPIECQQFLIEIQEKLKVKRDRKSVV